MKLSLVLTIALVGLLVANFSPGVEGRSRCPRCRPCKLCPRGKRPVLVTRKVCTRSSSRCPPPPGGRRGSLGFVVDDTGSMGDEIAAVRSTIASIMASNRVFRDYVVARFGDPYRKRVLRTSRASSVRSFLASLRPTGGGDCPEYSLSGIRDAAKAARPHSVLYLFTDASAKDASQKASVASLLRRKKIRLFVIRSGGLCGSAYQKEYEYLTKKSGGSVIRLTAKSQVLLVLRYIGWASAGRVPFKLPSSITKLRRIKPGCCRLVKRYVCRKVKGLCPKGYRRVVRRRRVCNGGGGGGGGGKRLGSLGFVVDDSGSMGTEIFAVRSSIAAVIAANRRFRNYVVASFSDPYKRHVTKTSSKSTVLSFLNALRPNGGGDCPEFSLSAVRDAARQALHRSVLLLFTDASAKDARLKGEVARLLRSKKTRLIVVKTGTLCGSAYKNEYDELARASGGRVITLTAKTGVADVMNFVKLAVAGRASFSKIPKTLTGLKGYKPRGKHCWTDIHITCRA